MKESSTYQAILEEARAEGFALGYALGFAAGALAEAKKLLRLLGEEACGPPDAATAAAIEQLDDLARLEAMLRRVRTAGGWQELLAASSGRRGGRRRSS